MSNDPAKKNACPGCGCTDVYYQTETDTWICSRCNYGWHLIERCTRRQNQQP